MRDGAGNVLPGQPRPVYVDPDAEVKIVVEEGALCFRFPGQADRYIPLRHVSRLIVPEHASMDMKVFCACARRGIPVLVQAREEGIVLRAVGMKHGDTGLRQRLLDLTADMNWPRLMSDWLQANRARIARGLARRLNAPPGSAGKTDSMQAWIDKRAQSLGGEQSARISDQALRGAALAWMHEALLQHGLDANHEAWLRDHVDLPAELGALLQFQLQPLRLGLLTRRRKWEEKQARSATALTCRQMVRSLERHRGRMERTGRDLLNRLHRWLVETA